MESDIGGADVRTVDQCLPDTALNVTLRALFAVAHLFAQHLRTLYKGRMPCGQSFCQSNHGDVEYKL